MGGQGGCDLRIEKFFGKIHKTKISGGGGVGFFFFFGGGGGGGVRVDVNEGLKYLCKFKNKIFFWGGGGVWGGVGFGESGWM